MHVDLKVIPKTPMLHRFSIVFTNGHCTIWGTIKVLEKLQHSPFTIFLSFLTNQIIKQTSLARSVDF